MAYDHILFEAPADGIAVITINRPDKLNALNRATIAELDSVISEAGSNSSIRGLILTGAGPKAFVAGADIREFQNATPVEMRALAARGQRLTRRLETLGKPSVAAINGFALGGGLELAMACTVRIASPNARLGQPEIKLGLVPGYGGTQRLPRLVGRGRALELLLTGEPIDAGEAYRIGLVNRVVEPDQLLAAARELLAKMFAGAPVAGALILDAVDAGLNVPLEDGLRIEASAFALSASTADAAEGTSAFLEKRKAVFTGK